ncbi:MAG: proline dehydrogenase family protein [Chloroflexota bacterium]|nr:proline dehydrogenase family protein [Chloroflexota bacterium]
MIRQTLFRLSQQPGLRDVATGNPIARKMASRFVAGETLDEALAAVRRINRRGMSATLDYLGENVRSDAEALESIEVTCAILRALAAAEVDCNVSLKLTQLGLDISEEFAGGSMEQVLDVAASLNTFVRVDMEGSEYTQRTLDLFLQLFVRYPNTGTVIQSYLYRSQADVERLIEAGARMRLVKGAYLEPPTVAFSRKEEVDANFVRLMEMLLTGGNYPAIATHDPAMIEATKQFAQRHQIGAEAFEFQMLYGIRRDLQTQLVAEGYRVRIYVPFGTQWYPYLMRRMAERPANVMFVLTNLAREAGSRR